MGKEAIRKANNGYLFNPPGEPMEKLQRELTAACRAGIQEIELFCNRPRMEQERTRPSIRKPELIHVSPPHD